MENSNGLKYATRMTPERKKSALTFARFILQRIPRHREPERNLTALEIRNLLSAARDLAYAITDDTYSEVR